MDQSNVIGVKELLEALEGLKVLAKAGKAVLADGKISVSDLPVLMSLLSDKDVLLAAAAGLSEVPAEVKNLSPDEIAQVGMAILAAYKEVKAA